MEPMQDRCEICGQPARVRVLAKYLNGAPVFKQYCLDCADKHHDTPPRQRDPWSRQHMSFASLLMVAGVFIVIVAAMGDYLGIRGVSGFGWYQSMGICIGAFFVLLGAMLRADVVAVFGTIVFGLAACSDLLGIKGAEGIGWKQNLAIAAGVVLTAVGVILRVRALRA